MVLAHIKREDESLFLVETTTSASVLELTEAVARTHNALRRITAACEEMDLLILYGACVATPGEEGLKEGSEEEGLEETREEGKEEEKDLEEGICNMKLDDSFQPKGGHTINK